MHKINKLFTPLLQDANAWALLGHTHYLTGDYSSAKDAYERTISYVHLPAHVHIIYLRLADIYLKEKEVKLVSHTRFNLVASAIILPNYIYISLLARFTHMLHVVMPQHMFKAISQCVANDNVTMNNVTE